jgi:hypothetical protein
MGEMITDPLADCAGDRETPGAPRGSTLHMPRVLAGAVGDRASEHPAADQPPDADPETPGGAHDALRATVRLVPEAEVWVWDLRRADAVVEGSWEDDWTGYPSRADAEKAAEERLAVLRAASRNRGGQQ